MRRKCWILVLLVICGVPGFAQETKRLTLEECVRTGIENSMTMKIAKSKVVSSEEKIEESNSTMLPSLKLNGSYTRLSNVENKLGTFVIPTLQDQYSFKLSASQPVYTGSRLSSALEAAKYNSSAAREDLNKDRGQLVLDIKNAYWNLFKAVDYKKSIEDNIIQTKAHLADLENFLKTGLATENDILKVKVQISNLQLMKMDADNSIELANIGLNNLMGIPLSTKIETTDKADTNSSTLVSPDQYKMEAMKSRPEIKAMELRIKAGKSSVDMVKAGLFPQIYATANYNYAKPNQRYMLATGQFKGTWDLGLSLSYDIWNWQTTSHQKAQAEATVEQAEFGMKQMKDAIELEVSSAYLTIIKSREKIAVAAEAITQAEENLRVTNERFKNGMVLNSEVLDAETALLTAKVNLTTAFVDYEVSLARLDKAIGKE